MTLTSCTECRQSTSGEPCSPEHAELDYALNHSPFVEQRPRIASLLREMHDEMQSKLRTPLPATIEHAYEPHTLLHGFGVRLLPCQGQWLILVLHPHLCGCSALTDEYVLHG